jgi:hypothetical protein
MKNTGRKKPPSTADPEGDNGAFAPRGEATL